MTISAAALEMRLTVKHLMRRHGIAPEPCIVPLTVPVAHPMTLDGLDGMTIDDAKGHLREHWPNIRAPRPTSISTVYTKCPFPRARMKARLKGTV